MAEGLERVGFYLSAAQPVETVLPQIARKALAAGERMLVVAEDPALRERIGRALWEDYPEDFLAHGDAAEPHAGRQPLLLSDHCEAPNGARLVALADGRWRDEAENFVRALLFFDETGRQGARAAWARFDGREDLEREFHEHQDGRWQRKR